MPKHDALPLNLPPRGLSRLEAATYVGVSGGKFDEMVEDGRMPRPKLIDRRRVWDKTEIDAHFAQLPHDGDEPTVSDWDAALCPPTSP